MRIVHISFHASRCSSWNQTITCDWQPDHLSSGKNEYSIKPVLRKCDTGRLLPWSQYWLWLSWWQAHAVLPSDWLGNSLTLSHKWNNSKLLKQGGTHWRNLKQRVLILLLLVRIYRFRERRARIILLPAYTRPSASGGTCTSVSGAVIYSPAWNVSWSFLCSVLFSEIWT